MPGIEFLRLEMVFTALTVAKAEKVLGQGVQAHRIQIEGAKRNVVVDDGLPLFGAQDFMYAIGRRGYLAVRLPESRKQGVRISVHSESPQ